MAKKKPEPAKTDPLRPSLSLLVKLGAIAVHTDELRSQHGVEEFDGPPLDGLLKDAEVQEWITAMTKMAFLPLKRNP